MYRKVIITCDVMIELAGDANEADTFKQIEEGSLRTGVARIISAINAGQKAGAVPGAKFDVSNPRMKMVMVRRGEPA